MPSELASSARALVDDYEAADSSEHPALVASLKECQLKLLARLKELEKGREGGLVVHMRKNKEQIAEYAGYLHDAQVALNKEQSKSPQDADELKRAQGNVEWYRNMLLPAQHDATWNGHQNNTTWLDYDELYTEMRKIRKIVGRPRKTAHSLGKSVFVPEHMRTYRRIGGY